MSQPDDRERRIQELEERLSRLSEASLRINESLDFETLLQNALDSARDLTGARYGVIATVDEQGGLETILTSGTSEESTSRSSRWRAARRSSRTSWPWPIPCEWTAGAPTRRRSS